MYHKNNTNSLFARVFICKLCTVSLSHILLNIYYCQYYSSTIYYIIPLYPVLLHYYSVISIKLFVIYCLAIVNAVLYFHIARLLFLAEVIESVFPYFMHYDFILIRFDRVSTCHYNKHTYFKKYTNIHWKFLYK